MRTENAFACIYLATFCCWISCFRKANLPLSIHCKFSFTPLEVFFLCVFRSTFPNRLEDDSDGSLPYAAGESLHEVLALTLPQFQLHWGRSMVTYPLTFHTLIGTLVQFDAAVSTGLMTNPAAMFIRQSISECLSHQIHLQMASLSGLSFEIWTDRFKLRNGPGTPVPFIFSLFLPKLLHNSNFSDLGFSENLSPTLFSLTTLWNDPSIIFFREKNLLCGSLLSKNFWDHTYLPLFLFLSEDVRCAQFREVFPWIMKRECLHQTSHFAQARVVLYRPHLDPRSIVHDLGLPVGARTLFPRPGSHNCFTDKCFDVEAQFWNSNLASSAWSKIHGNMWPIIETDSCLDALADEDMRIFRLLFYSISSGLHLQLIVLVTLF